MHKAILSHLSPKHPWQDRIQCHTQLQSTNDLAKELARTGAEEGTVILADSQTGGRGRMGRSFHSPAGNGIYMSVILRPGCPAGDLMHLTCAVGVAVCDAVEQVTGTRPDIKWINDLVMNQKKVGGILTELSVNSAGMVDFAVIGIGINCNGNENDFPPELRSIASTLTCVTGAAVERCKLIAAMIEALKTLAQRLLSRREEYLRQYRKDCITLGQEVRIHSSEGISQGIALDIDDAGGLMVALADGTTKCVSSGEVSVRGLYGYAN